MKRRHQFGEWLFVLAILAFFAFFGFAKYDELRMAKEAEVRYRANFAELQTVIDKSMSVAVRVSKGHGIVATERVDFPWIEGCSSKMSRVPETGLLDDCSAERLYRESPHVQSQYRNVDEIARAGQFRNLRSVVLNAYGGADGNNLWNLSGGMMFGPTSVDLSAYSRDVWVVDLTNQIVTAHRIFTSSAPSCESVHCEIPDGGSYLSIRKKALDYQVRGWLDALGDGR